MSLIGISKHCHPERLPLTRRTLWLVLLLGLILKDHLR